jgi:hypothetical protein
MAWRRRRGGRPKKADAKRRRTTLSGRAPDRDLGSPELVYRKTRVANGSPVPVELVDCASSCLEKHAVFLVNVVIQWVIVVNQRILVVSLWCLSCAPGRRAEAPQP